MSIRWLDDAVGDLQSLRSYLAQDSPLHATKVVRKILDSVQILLHYPEMGRKGRVANTRELVIVGAPYIVPYRVRNNLIEILRVLHASMQWPEKL
jgi:toxin ParE1/3/4